MVTFRWLGGLQNTRGPHLSPAPRSAAILVTTHRGVGDAVANALRYHIGVTLFGLCLAFAWCS